MASGPYGGTGFGAEVLDVITSTVPRLPIADSSPSSVVAQVCHAPSVGILGPTARRAEIQASASFIFA